MPNPVALITGASSGIGEDLARQFANHGYDLVLTARREERLQALARELEPLCGVTVVTADLAKAKGPATLHKALGDLEITVDVLVNNAGVALSGRFGEAQRKSVTDLLNLNVRALTELTHLIVPGMIERGHGRLLNVASVASFQPMPGLAVYAASKAFVLSFSEALSEELRGSGVSVTALCPGPTRTEMVSSFDGVDGMDWLLASAASVAREGYDACAAGQVIRVPGVLNQALVTWSQYQPRWLTRAFSGLTARSSLLAGDRS